MHLHRMYEYTGEAEGPHGGQGFGASEEDDTRLLFIDVHRSSGRLPEQVIGGRRGRVFVVLARAAEPPEGWVEERDAWP